jgi:hypothetical protein
MFCIATNIAVNNIVPAHQTIPVIPITVAIQLLTMILIIRPANNHNIKHIITSPIIIFFIIYITQQCKLDIDLKSYINYMKTLQLIII